MDHYDVEEYRNRKESGENEDEPEPEPVWRCAPNPDRFQSTVRYYAEQVKLLITDPYRAADFDTDRSIRQQHIELLARMRRTCSHCGEEQQLPSDAFVIEFFDPAWPDWDHPRIYDAYGTCLTYADGATPPDERTILEAVEAWCVDALIATSCLHHKVTGRYLSATELARNVPTATELWNARGGSRSRMSTWINTVMPVNVAIKRVQPSAALRAIAALRKDAQLDESAA